MSNEGESSCFAKLNNKALISEMQQIMHDAFEPLQRRLDQVMNKVVTVFLKDN